MIKVSDLTKSYNNFLAVDSLSFDVSENQVAAILGLNGAGKTTTLRMLTGFLSPTKGYIQINSFELLTRPMELKRQIGYLPETPALYPYMKVIDFLRYMYRIRMYTKEGEETAIETCLSKVDIKEKLNNRLGELSAGYRKRVGIAQAIIHNPPVLIFDEPISELDPIQIIEMRNLIIQLKKDHTILISSHILGEVSKTADRFFFIKRGKLISEESKESIQSKNSSLEDIFLALNQA